MAHSKSVSGGLASASANASLNKDRSEQPRSPDPLSSAGAAATLAHSNQGPSTQLNLPERLSRQAASASLSKQPSITERNALSAATAAHRAPSFGQSDFNSRNSDLARMADPDEVARINAIAVQHAQKDIENALKQRGLSSAQIARAASLKVSPPVTLDDASRRIVAERIAREEDAFAAATRAAGMSFKSGDSRAHQWDDVLKKMSVRRTTDGELGFSWFEQRLNSFDQRAGISPEARIRDTRSIMETAQKNVRSRMDVMDRQILATRYELPKSQVMAREAIGRERLENERLERGMDCWYGISANKIDNKVDIGGRIMTTQEVEAIAARHVKEVLDEIDIKVEEERKRQEIIRLEREAEERRKQEERRIADERAADERRERERVKAEERAEREKEMTVIANIRAAEQQKLSEEREADRLVRESEQRQRNAEKEADRLRREEVKEAARKAKEEERQKIAAEKEAERKRIAEEKETERLAKEEQRRKLEEEKELERKRLAEEKEAQRAIQAEEDRKRAEEQEAERKVKEAELEAERKVKEAEKEAERKRQAEEKEAQEAESKSKQVEASAAAAASATAASPATVIPSSNSADDKENAEGSLLASTAVLGSPVLVAPPIVATSLAPMSASPDDGTKPKSLSNWFKDKTGKVSRRLSKELSSDPVSPSKDKGKSVAESSTNTSSGAIEPLPPITSVIGEDEDEGDKTMTNSDAAALAPVPPITSTADDEEGDKTLVSVGSVSQIPLEEASGVDTAPLVSTEPNAIPSSTANATKNELTTDDEEGQSLYEDAGSQSANEYIDADDVTIKPHDEGEAAGLHSENAPNVFKEARVGVFKEEL